MPYGNNSKMPRASTGLGNGEGISLLQPTMASGNHCKISQLGQGKAPAKTEFCKIWMPKTTSCGTYFTEFSATILQAVFDYYEWRTTTITTVLRPFSGTTQVSQHRRNIHTLTAILIINHPLSASSYYYYDPQHPPHSIYVLDSLCTTSLQVLFGLPQVWNPPLHTPYMYSSPNYCLPFATHAHTNLELYVLH